MSEIQPYPFQLIDVRLFEIHVDRQDIDDNVDEKEELKKPKKGNLKFLFQ